MIQFFQVQKVYAGRTKALIDVSFKINKSEFVFILGASGAGKTTLLRLIIAAEKPSKGQVVVCGRHTTRLTAAMIASLRRKIGFVFQDSRLLWQSSVEENVGLGLQISGMHSKEVRERSLMMLQTVGLLRKAKMMPCTLSGGEQKRVAVARALATNPKILLVDEPTSSLDQEQAREIMLLLQTAHEQGTTIVVATHDTRLPQQHCCHQFILEEGKVRVVRKAAAAVIA